MDPGSPPSNAPGLEVPPARRAAGGAPRDLVPLVGGARLPLAFIGGGLLALAAGALWLALIGICGWPAYFHPHLVGLVHLWLPGALLSICLGASYQLMPVVLGTPLRAGSTLLWTHAGLHVMGVILLVAGLTGGHYLTAGGGGLALVAGVCGLIGVTLRTFPRSTRRDTAAWSFPLSASWLGATVLAGVMLAVNRRAPFLSLDTVALLRAHAHLGLAGYFLTLLQGVTFQLVPMFTLGEARHPRQAAWGLAGTQVALLLLVPGLAWGWPPAISGGTLLLLLSLGNTARAFIATLATRRRRSLDPGVRAFVTGLLFLAFAALGGGALALGLVGPAHRLTGEAAYGLLVALGGLSLCVLGLLCKILPFLVWMKAYGPHVGRRPVPVATALASRGLELLWWVTHVGGTVLLTVGVLGDIPVPTGLGAGLVTFGVCAYLANAGRVLLHLRSHARIAPS
jgi:hypothetical protein